ATTTIGGFPGADDGTGTQISPDKRKEPLSGGVKLPKAKASSVALGGLTETTQLNDTASLGTTLSANGKDVQYYDASDGKFYKIDKYGDVSALSDKIFHNVENVNWSPNKNKAILEYPDGANIIYDFTAKTQVTLPKHWKDFDFSPTGDNIVMKSMGLDPDNRWLAISSDDGSKIQPIEPLGTKDSTVYPEWSNNNQIIAMYTEGVDFNRQEVFFVGLNNENFKSTIVEGRGFQPKWSPEGDRLLYSVYSSDDNLKPNLWVVNAQGDSIGSGRKKLNIETWADKCAYSNSSEIYCAVPEDLPEGAGLFPELAEQTSDQLYKIDTRTGLKKLIAIPDDSYNMSNIMISEDEKYLYFTDSATKRIYKINLK
ncbi:hypothetical protein DRH27_05170, partial [Candidatus Falkowbacteria bacterium]